MFSKRTWTAAVTLVCILALIAVAIVEAQNTQLPGRPGGQQPPREQRMMDAPVCPVRLFAPPPAPQMQRLAQELQLSEEQRNQATRLVGALDARIKQIVGDKMLMRDLLAELKSETTSADRIRELGNQISRQEGEILQAELAMWLKYEQMLTPEQRAKFWTIFPRPNRPMGPPPGPGGPPVPPGPVNPPPPPLPE